MYMCSPHMYALDMLSFNLNYVTTGRAEPNAVAGRPRYRYKLKNQEHTPLDTRETWVKVIIYVQTCSWEILSSPIRTKAIQKISTNASS